MFYQSGGETFESSKHQIYSKAKAIDMIKLQERTQCFIKVEVRHSRVQVYKIRSYYLVSTKIAVNVRHID
jgi:hypothetical protein